jgi:hypothetical protein
LAEVVDENTEHGVASVLGKRLSKGLKTDQQTIGEKITQRTTASSSSSDNARVYTATSFDSMNVSRMEASSSHSWIPRAMAMAAW